MIKIFSSKTHWFVALILAAALFFGFASCSSDSDDDDDDDSSSSSTTYATLPSSVGTNELSGKSWTYTSSSGNSKETWIFNSDGSATFTENGNDDGETFTQVRTYNYTYNSNSKLVYLGLKSFSNSSNNVSYSSVAEAKTLMVNYGLSGDELEIEVAEVALEFATKLVFRYDIDSTAKTLELIHYFDGELPTAVEMDYVASDSSSGSYTYTEIELEDGGIEIYSSSSSSSGKYCLYPTYSNGSFSGTLFQKSSGYTSLGTAAGTYTTSGTGTTGSSVTLTFTTLPSSFTVLSANTAYKLEQGEYENKFRFTYTLQQ
ncbi:MAG: hypothetical protein II811_02240 [Spirochaetaceae bacterium]|nr:hypothetical protein [Spirochaetaceae bacterium]